LIDSNKPKHGVFESELATNEYKLPKIPTKGFIIVEDNAKQISILELAKDEETVIKISEDLIKQSLPPMEQVPAFNETTLIAANQSFGKSKQIALSSLLKILKYEIDGHDVNVHLTKQQIEKIGDHKIDWQIYLREYFQIKEISLNFNEDNTVEAPKIAYTSAEQFKEMYDENKSIQELVKTFNLKIKY
jgi:hypothetical protein